jgi:hypothetical protein
MTSVSEYFAPLDASVEGLGLILVPEITTVIIIFLFGYNARQSLKVEFED